MVGVGEALLEHGSLHAQRRHVAAEPNIGAEVVDVALHG